MARFDRDFHNIFECLNPEKLHKIFRTNEMYERYWNLDRNPFDDHGDFAGFYRSEAHQGALLKLRFLIEQGKGAGLLVGATGTGKSFVIQALQREISEPAGPFVHLVFPQMAAEELLNYLAAELGAEGRSSHRDMIGLDRTVLEIDDRLRRLNDEGRQPVIVVDEAHLIDDVRIFQALRLLLNFQQFDRCRFSLILVGQSELLEQVHRVASLDERLAVKCILRPLSIGETDDYVAHRLAAAGATRQIFQPEAIHVLHELSGGIPRRINRLCDMALLMGYADDCTEITAEQMESVADELLAVVPD